MKKRVFIVLCLVSITCLIGVWSSSVVSGNLLRKSFQTQRVTSVSSPKPDTFEWNNFLEACKYGPKNKNRLCGYKKKNETNFIMDCCKGKCGSIGSIADGVWFNKCSSDKDLVTLNRNTRENFRFEHTEPKGTQWSSFVDTCKTANSKNRACAYKTSGQSLLYTVECCNAPCVSDVRTDPSWRNKCDPNKYVSIKYIFYT